MGHWHTAIHDDHCPKCRSETMLTSHIVYRFAFRGCKRRVVSAAYKRKGAAQFQVHTAESCFQNQYQSMDNFLRYLGLEKKSAR